MTLVTTSPLGDGFTLADWQATPDDGRRYELIGGTIVVSPTPVPAHQRASRRLQQLLDNATPPGHEVFAAPIGLRLPGDQMLEPDIVVVPDSSVGPRVLGLPVLLVVEVVSVGSRVHDTVTKRHVYAEAGIEHYWLVDGTRAAPRVVALHLVDGEYETVVDTGDRLAVDTPVSVRFKVADLFRAH